MYQRPSFIDSIRQAIDTDRLIIRLILVNVVVFMVLSTIGLVLLFTNDFNTTATRDALAKVLAWLIMPGDPQVLLRRPWTLITNCFTHYQFMHLLVNMLFLYWFGGIVSDFLGPRKTLPLYVYGGVIGALVYFGAASLFPNYVSPTGAAGASASVMAVMVGAATLLPNYPAKLLLIGEVKLKFVAAFFVVVNLLPALAEHNTSLGEPIAHLSGALFGFVYIRQMKVGHDWSIPFSAMVDFLESLPDRFRRKKGPRIAYKRTDGSNPVLRKVSSPTINKDKQSRIDAILDKINQSGYDSLSKEEKEFLFRSSKED